MNSTADTTPLMMPQGSLSLASALRAHWPEYLIEAWALGTFMVSACVFGVLLEDARAPLRELIPDEVHRRVLAGVAMGITAIGLIYSPWGKRSGAHMNPAITLAFLRAGKIARIDAVLYVLAQFAGGTCGVYLALALLGEALAAPPVSYVATAPGPHGAWAAVAAEFIISFLMMTMVLNVSGSRRYTHLTGVLAGLLVAAFICVEAPYSGMSMNPARSFASALPARTWTGFWIYLVVPVAAMQAALFVHNLLQGRDRVSCAKLIHSPDQRCIHCGHVPTQD